MIIEDVGAQVANDMSFTLAWAGMYPTREALAELLLPSAAEGVPCVAA